MTVRRVTVSLDEQAWQAADKAANAQGVSLSTWLSGAARERARVEEGLRGVAEYEAEYGAPTAEELDMTRKELDALGIGHPELPAERAKRLAALRRFYGEEVGADDESGEEFRLSA